MVRISLSVQWTPWAACTGLVSIFSTALQEGPAFYAVLTIHRHGRAASETELVKYIKKQLCPLPLEGSAPPMFLLHNATLLDAVKSLATRTNYGLVLENGESPRSLALWRWETTTDAGFTEDLARIRTERRQRRELAKETLLSLFGALTETERAELTTAAASVGSKKRKIVRNNSANVCMDIL